MTFDPLTWKDLIMVGFLLGLWWSERSRRDQGRRLGAAEKAIAKLLGLEDHNGKH